MGDKIIILHESLAQSIASDAFTFACTVGVIGIGWALGSDAMQWAGFALAALSIFGRAANVSKGVKRMTVDEAQQFLAAMKEVR